LAQELGGDVCLNPIGLDPALLKPRAVGYRPIMKRSV
jgi:hypothetical protein